MDISPAEISANRKTALEIVKRLDYFIRANLHSIGFSGIGELRQEMDFLAHKYEIAKTPDGFKLLNVLTRPDGGW